MRIISYDEFVFNVKNTCYPINEIITAISKDKNTILPLLILHKEELYSNMVDNIVNAIDSLEQLHYRNCFSNYFYDTQDGINALEILFHEGYLRKEDVINAFKSIEIDSEDVYKRIYQYAAMYDYRKQNPIFPFKLHIDTEFLKEKLKNAPEQFKVKDIEFEYNLNSFYSRDYDELMLYNRESSNMNDFKSALLEDPLACVLGQKPNRKNKWNYEDPGFTDVWILMDYLQIFIDDGLITNNHINKILSEVEITNIDWFMHIGDFLRYMLKIKKFRWHRYTLDIDVNMLQNKVEGAFYTPITEEGRRIDKNYFLNLYNILDSPLKFDKTPQQRHELDMFYREKYRKLCEEEATTPSYKHNQLMLKYKESDFYKEIKNTFNGKPTFDKFILNEDKDYPNPAYKMVNIMQILQNENALTNDYINKMFADLKIYRFNKDKLFPVLLDYLLEFLKIKNTSCNLYTIDIDLDMLVNKTILAHDEEFITKERLYEVLKEYNIIVDFNIKSDRRRAKDNKYREKYEIQTNNCRVISYGELAYNIKFYGGYENELVPFLKEDSTNLKKFIFNNNDYIRDFSCDFEDRIYILEILCRENIVSNDEINECFNSITIDSKEQYKLMYQYARALEYIEDNPIFPFCLKINVNRINEIIESAPKEFVEEDFLYSFDLHDVIKETYDSIIEEYKEYDGYKEMKNIALKNPVVAITGSFIGSTKYRSSIMTLGINIEGMITTLQLRMEEGIITNTYINKVLSELQPINIEDWLELFMGYANKMIYLKKFQWHKYTIDIDLDMLLNKIAYFCDYYNDREIYTERVIERYERLGYPLPVNKPLSKTLEIDEYYRRKYNTLYLKEINKEKEDEPLRIMSPEEYYDEIRFDCVYDKILLPNIKIDKSYLKQVILNTDKNYPLAFKYTEVNLEYLNVLFTFGLITKPDVYNAISSIDINNNDTYKRMAEFVNAYSYRIKDKNMPYNLKLDINILNNKLEQASNKYKNIEIKQTYNSYNFYKPTFEALKNKIKNSDAYKKLKESNVSYNNLYEVKNIYAEYCDIPNIAKPEHISLIQSADVIFTDLPTLLESNYLVLYQLLLDDNLITNDIINYDLSKRALHNTNVNLYELLVAFLLVKRYKLPEFTFDINLDMLQNSVESILEERSKYSNIYKVKYQCDLLEKLGVTVKLDIPKEVREQKRLMYNRIYEKRYLQEKKNKEEDFFYKNSKKLPKIEIYTIERLRKLTKSYMVEHYSFTNDDSSLSFTLLMKFKLSDNKELCLQFNEESNKCDIGYYRISNKKNNSKIGIVDYIVNYYLFNVADKLCTALASKSVYEIIDFLEYILKLEDFRKIFYTDWWFDDSEQDTNWFTDKIKPKIWNAYISLIQLKIFFKNILLEIQNKLF